MPQNGFTLIEILIVVGIIAILASVTFVALDPLTRFRNARDADRWRDVNAILTAIKVDQIDNVGNEYIHGVLHDSFGAKTLLNTNYMISNATTTSGCNAVACAAVAANDCVNLQGLVTEGYIASLPVSQKGKGNWSNAITGYYLRITSGGAPNYATSSIQVAACEAENTSSIAVSG